MYPIIRLSDHYYLPSYFTVIALAYCLAILYLHTRSQNLQMNIKVSMELAIVIMVIGFLGGRLFHVFYELPEHYFKKPMDVFKVWQGGFVFYGGALSASLASIVYLKLQKENVYRWMDVLAPIVPVTYFLGRFATLLSGSGYGKPTNLPWAIVYPPGTEAPSGTPLHPTPIYAMLWEALIFVVVWRLENKTSFKKQWGDGALFFIMISLHGAGRLIMEQFRNDLRGFSPLGLTISSWVSLFIIVAGLWFLWRRWIKTNSAHPTQG